jgi:hypothetical protein
MLISRWFRKYELVIAELERLSIDLKSLSREAATNISIAHQQKLSRFHKGNKVEDFQEDRPRPQEKAD